MNRQTIRVILVAAALAIAGGLAMWSTWQAPVHWTLDALFYQERVLELRGADHTEAHASTFEGSIAADLRRVDPKHTGSAEWVSFNEQFYERRVAVPLAAVALYPIAGERSLHYVSLAGYLATILALFGLLLLRFRLTIAAVVAGATVLLPPLTQHSGYPITDSWGLALQILAFTLAILTIDRGYAWVPLWAGTIGLLAFTRENAWVAIFAVGAWATLRKSPRALSLAITGALAAIPAVLVFPTPVRDLLAMLVNDFERPTDTSWWFIVSEYPAAVLDLVRADVGFLRRGEWFAAAYLLGGCCALLLLVWRGRVRGTSVELMALGVLFATFYVLAAPAYSELRLELAFVPMAAFGLALTLERVTARVAEVRGARARRLPTQVSGSSSHG